MIQLFSRRSRVAGWLSLIAMPAFAFALGGCSGTSADAGARTRSARDAQRVEVVEIRRGQLVESLNVVGSLAANESAQLRPEINGLVRSILFEEGSRVRAGDLLVKLDDGELRAQLDQARARMELTESNLRRSENLIQSNNIPASELDRARAEAASARAEVALLEVRLDRTSLRAPFDGVTGSRTISPGDYVTGSTIITTIDDLSVLKAAFPVPERFLGKLRVGSPVSVRARALDGEGGTEIEVSGEVYFVSSTIDRSTRSSEVKAMLTDAPPGFRPGMYANVEIVLAVRDNALTVPEGAILASARGPQIVVVGEEEGRPAARFVPVRTGLRTRGVVEIEPIEDELKDGDRVVASGVGALVLYPGVPLDPVELRPRFRGEI